jgi:hypothetical protein
LVYSARPGRPWTVVLFIVAITAASMAIADEGEQAEAAPEVGNGVVSEVTSSEENPVKINFSLMPNVEAILYDDPVDGRPLEVDLLLRLTFFLRF